MWIIKFSFEKMPKVTQTSLIEAVLDWDFPSFYTFNNLFVWDTLAVFVLLLRLLSLTLLSVFKDTFNVIYQYVEFLVFYGTLVITRVIRLHGLFWLDTQRMHSRLFLFLFTHQTAETILLAVFIIGLFSYRIQLTKLGSIESSLITYVAASPFQFFNILVLLHLFKFLFLFLEGLLPLLHLAILNSEKDRISNIESKKYSKKPQSDVFNLIKDVFAIVYSTKLR